MVLNIAFNSETLNNFLIFKLFWNLFTQTRAHTVSPTLCCFGVGPVSEEIKISEIIRNTMYNIPLIFHYQNADLWALYILI